MVKPISLIIMAVSTLQVAGCSDAGNELCDQPESGGSDDAGDDGSAISIERSDASAYEEVGFSAPTDMPGRIAPEHSSRLMGLDTDGPSLTFRNWAEDPRKPVTDEDELQSYPLRAVVFISLSYEVPEGIKTEIGTGFLAGPRHVITNRHVVEVIGADVNEWLDNHPMFFQFNVFPGRSKLAILNGGAWAVERVIWNPFPGMPYNDYALLILEDDIERSGRYGRLGLCSASKNTLDELSVITAGYPDPAYKCGQTPDPPTSESDCACGGWMYTQACEISEVDPQELMHTCLTQPGQSGSPLWVDECVSNDTRCTVGIHYGKSGLKSGAVRWEDEDIEWLHKNICQWTSDYAAMPPFCD